MRRVKTLRQNYSVIAIILLCSILFISISLKTALAAVNQSLIDKFKDDSMRGIWGHIEPEELEDAITICKNYYFNTIFVGFAKLKGADNKLSVEGKAFLDRIAAENGKIKVILDFYSEAYADLYKQTVKTFLKDLYLYRNTHPSAYNNILAFLIGDDVFGLEKMTATQDFARYIRQNIYSNALDGIPGPLDIPLMIDCGGVSPATVDSIKNDNLLKNDFEIIGGYRYPFLIDTDSHNKNLKEMRDGLESAGITTDSRFFTVLQAHTQDWYNAIFYNTDDYAHDLRITADIVDPFPEGIQSASLVYQSLRNNTKQYLFYNWKYLWRYLNNAVSNSSNDRVAEIGIANKLVDILWKRVLKDSTLNNNIGYIFDTSGVFYGSVLNFLDSTNTRKGALLVINANKANNIFGKASGTNVLFKQFSKDSSTSSLSFTALGINKPGSSLPALKVKRVDFPNVTDIPCTISNDTIQLTVPQINENTFVLLTYDDTIVTEISTALTNYAPEAKRLAREALEARLNKTQQEFTEIENTEYTIPESYKTTLGAIDARLQLALTDLAKLTYRELRSEISKIGDLQVELYNSIINIQNPKNLYSFYPSGVAYYGKYYPVDEIAYRSFILPRLLAGEPQRFHFYLLDKYLEWKKGNFAYIDGVNAPTIKSNSAVINWATEPNKALTSTVEYDTAANYNTNGIYGLPPVSDLSLVTNHSVKIVGLSPNTTYHYRVRSTRDGINGEILSYDYSFNTAVADTSVPSTPVVTDEGQFTKSKTQLYASWSSADAQSEIAEYKYKIYDLTASAYITSNWISTGNWCCGGPTPYVTAAVTLIDGHKYRFEVQAKNGAGLLSSTGYSDGITVDATAPTGSISINNGATYANSATVTLNLGATDAVSGVTQMKFSNDNITYSVAEAYATSKSWTLTTGNGTKTVYAKFKDAIGNWSGAYSDTIKLDTTAASTPVVRDGTGATDIDTTTSTTTLSANWNTCTDAESGVVEYQYKITYKTPINATEQQLVAWTSRGTNISVTRTGLSLTKGNTYYFKVRAKNGAGLWSTTGSSDGIKVQ